jgi:hypothetical protein
MTITASFVQPACNGRNPGIGINRVRTMEQIAVDGTTAAAALAYSASSPGLDR